jgi:hypothetical protein
MSVAIRGGVVLGLLVTFWTYFMGFTGWYKHPVLLLAFWLVVPAQIAVLIWSLGQTADRQGYWAQVGLGVLISALGGAIIFCSSLLFTTVVFPHSIREMQTLQENALRQSGRSQAEVRRMIEAAARDATPMAQALSGFLGALFTGLLASIGIAAFGRRKRAGAAFPPES